MSALDTQVGGSYYKDMAIQPMEYSMANQLDACQHTAIKYITRFREKGGIQDLEKAKHVIDMLIEFERRGEFKAMRDELADMVRAGKSGMPEDAGGCGNVGHGCAK